MNFNNIPKELRALRQWICWKYKRTTNGKIIRIPISPHTGYPASSKNPRAWGTFSQAAGQVERQRMDGIAFVFSANEPYGGVNLNHSIDPVTNKLQPWAQEIVNTFDTYTEITPSGRGLNIIFVAGDLPSYGRRHKGREIYVFHKYFTFTGNLLEGTPKAIMERQEQSIAFYNDVSDAVITANALRRQKTKDDFATLLSGDWRSLYASPLDAWIGFCKILMHNDDGDEQIDRIFRQTGLMNERWDEYWPEMKMTLGEHAIQIARGHPREVPGMVPLWR